MQVSGCQPFVAAAAVCIHTPLALRSLASYNGTGMPKRKWAAHCHLQSGRRRNGLVGSTCNHSDDSFAFSLFSECSRANSASPPFPR